ncbi:hypothetical protein BH11CYA1_BH11CYA1_07130 [soil metagenome]
MRLLLLEVQVDLACWVDGTFFPVSGTSSLTWSCRGIANVDTQPKLSLTPIFSSVLTQSDIRSRLPSYSSGANAWVRLPNCLGADTRDLNRHNANPAANIGVVWK